MEEEVLPIGIDSEVKHVKSEIDRVDAIFTVATGSMGRQEVNYHILDEDRDRRISRPSINKSPLQHRRSIISDILKKEIQSKTSDNSNRQPRFSLPEINSSNQQEKKYQTRKVNKPSKSIEKEQLISNITTNINGDEKQESPSASTLEIPEHCRPNVNNTLRNQVESLLPFYSFNELAQHNDSTDGWICIFGHIYDITSFIKKIYGTSAYQQLIDHTGDDISSWFDKQTNGFILLNKNLSIIETLTIPFWKTNDYLIGRLIQHCRYIRLIHDFSPRHPYLLEVDEEETVGQIARKFLKYNSHIFSYIWRYNGHILDFNKTLTENGISNEESLHDQYGWRSDNENCPTILLYFSDDLTIA